MRFDAATRKAVLTAHMVASLGWMGAVAGFIVLDVTTVASDDEATLRACYIGMDLLTNLAIVPLAFAALVSGVILALGTTWGLFRHYWVLISLLLTLVATAVLLVQVPVIGHRAELARDPLTSPADLAAMGHLLPHSIGGTLVLLFITVLNVYKPRGVTPYGWRKENEQDASERRPDLRNP